MKEDELTPVDAVFNVLERAEGLTVRELRAEVEAALREFQAREGALTPARFALLLDAICSHVMESENPVIAAAAVAAALALPCVAGRSITQIAADCGVSKAAISASKTAFERATGIK